MLRATVAAPIPINTRRQAVVALTILEWGLVIVIFVNKLAECYRMPCRDFVNLCKRSGQEGPVVRILGLFRAVMGRPAINRITRLAGKPTSAETSSNSSLSMKGYESDLPCGF